MRAVAEGDLRPDDRPHAPLVRRPGELHRSGETVVVRQGQRPVVQPAGGKDQLERCGRALQEGEGGVAVEFDVLTHTAAPTTSPR